MRGAGGSIVGYGLNPELLVRGGQRFAPESSENDPRAAQAREVIVGHSTRE
jgi:hypothetical protein